MQGVYTLLIRISEPLRVRIGALGVKEFNEGIWIYVGSAMGATSTNLEYRISRHLSSVKKVHWHIDYLLMAEAEIIEVIWAETKSRKECYLAQMIRNKIDFIAGPIGFGSSDCDSKCGTHIYLYKGKSQVIRRMKSLFESANLIAHTLDELGI